MTRAEQNTLILNSITNQLKDLPNAQQIIQATFDSWFRDLVAAGAALVMQGNAQPTQGAAGEVGGSEGGGAPPQGGPEG